MNDNLERSTPPATQTVEQRLAEAEAIIHGLMENADTEFPGCQPFVDRALAFFADPSPENWIEGDYHGPRPGWAQFM